MLCDYAIELRPEELFSGNIFRGILNCTRSVNRENRNGMWIGAYSNFTDSGRVGKETMNMWSKGGGDEKTYSMMLSIGGSRVKDFPALLIKSADRVRLCLLGG